MHVKRNILFVLVLIIAIVFSVREIDVFAQTSPSPTESPSPTPEDDNEEEDEEDNNVCDSVPECSEKNYDCSRCIEYLTEKKDEASEKANTLASEIQATDNQIGLTEARISAAEEQIRTLQDDIEIAQIKISDLEIDIDATTKLLVERINAVYQVGRMAPWEVFLTSDNITDVFNRLKYLRLVQIYDKKRIYAAEQAKSDYDNQKSIFEEKEVEAQALSTKLEEYNSQLEDEKSSKQSLLDVTRNDEARYQSLLAEARAERAIVLGGGDEVYLRDVDEGDSIGSVINGASGCSTGRHLHFSVYEGTTAKDPSSYLSSKSFTYSYDEGQYGYYGTISPNGSYPWPLSDPIKINQGYGSHGFAQQFYPSGFHDGIDMDGGSLTVRAVRSGKLYEGSYSCSNGPLTYAKIEHDDGLITWYLHIYPN